MAASLALKMSLQDDYTAKINKIINSTEKAAKVMNNASAAADKVNGSMKAAGNASQIVSSGFEKASSSAKRQKGTLKV